MAKSVQQALTREKNHKLSDVFTACEVSLKRFLRRFYSRPEEIDDLAQEAFLRAFNAGQQREIRSPKAYLFRVARNIALRELGKSSRQLTDYLEEAVNSESHLLEPSAEEELIAQQKLKHCCLAIADLPEQCRRVFLLRKIHAYSHREIAQELGISTRTVEKHIAKGVDRFTSYLQQREKFLPANGFADRKPQTAVELK